MNLFCNIKWFYGSLNFDISTQSGSIGSAHLAKLSSLLPFQSAFPFSKVRFPHFNLIYFLVFDYTVQKLSEIRPWIQTLQEPKTLRMTSAESLMTPQPTSTNAANGAPTSPAPRLDPMEVGWQFVQGSLFIKPGEKHLWTRVCRILHDSKQGPGSFALFLQ